MDNTRVYSKCTALRKDGKPCSNAGLRNGFCMSHGGNNHSVHTYSENKHSITRKDCVAQQIEEAKNKLKIHGPTLASKIKYVELNPQIMDIKSDIVNITALIELMIQDLDFNEYTGKDKIWLMKTLAELTNTSSALKERAFKIRQGYFDIESMKLVMVQVINSLKHLKLEVQGVEPTKLTKDFMATLIDKAVLNIETVKVPMVQ